MVVVRDEFTCKQLQDVLNGCSSETQVGRLLLEQNFEQVVMKHMTRTSNLRNAVLHSKHLAVQPASATITDDAQMSRDERECWLAAEIPGWQDRGGHLELANTRAGNAASTTCALAGSAEEVFASHQAAVDLIALQAEDSDINSATHDQQEGHGPSFSAATANSASLSNNTRPFVGSETRLLWKAAAHILSTKRKQLQASLLCVCVCVCVCVWLLLANLNGLLQEFHQDLSELDIAASDEPRTDDVFASSDDPKTVVASALPGLQSRAESGAGSEQDHNATLAKQKRPRLHATVVQWHTPSEGIMRDKRVRLSSDVDTSLPTAAAAADCGNTPSVRQVWRYEQTAFVSLRQLEPTGGAFQTLVDLRPSLVVLYDPDPTFTRELELYRAAVLPASEPLRVYYLVHAGSAEEQRYLSALSKEKLAFEKLISAKSYMAPSSTDAVAMTQVASVGRSHGEVDAWGIENLANIDSRLSRGGVSASTGIADALALLTPHSKATYKSTLPDHIRPLAVGISGEDVGRRIVIVDMREFRAQLPMQLHNIGLCLVPLTLAIGDYILSPDMVVERKSLPDLVSSLASGRLHDQATAMAKHYATPLLAIEFDPSKPFVLQNELPPEVQISHTISKLALLTLHFPAMRILWCRDPAATTQFFASLKQVQEEPDPDTALIVGDGFEITAVEDLDAADFGSTRREMCIEMIRHLPGVMTTNYVQLASECGSIFNLVDLSESDLSVVLGGCNAQSLHDFLHRRYVGSL
jgi:ERCC4-type nuclease